MRVLLLDDASEQLASLAVELRERGCQTVRFNDAIRALRAIAQQSYDMIICTAKPKKTSAYHVLKAISIKFPRLIRIAVDNNQAELSAQQANNYAHAQFSSTSTNADIAQQLVNFRSANKRITKAAVIKAVKQVKTLPSPPKVYLQLKALLAENNCDSDKIADIITQDPALAAKVLHCSNNSFNANAKPVTSISDAVTKMGIETLTFIVMTAELFSQESPIADFSIEEEQALALATARFAASLVTAGNKQETMLIGLLHRLGMLVLLDIDQHLTKKYLALPATSRHSLAIQRKIFGTDYCQIGAYLLHMWSFSYPIIKSVLEHASPQKLLAQPFGHAHAVYVASNLLLEQPLDDAFIKQFELLSSLDTLNVKAFKYR